METQICPAIAHFHVVFEQLGTFARPSRTIVAGNPMEAIQEFIHTLPCGWRGGISVFDDDIGHEDEMPLAHLVLD